MNATDKKAACRMCFYIYAIRAGLLQYPVWFGESERLKSFEKDLSATVRTEHKPAITASICKEYPHCQNPDVFSKRPGLDKIPCQTRSLIMSTGHAKAIHCSNCRSL